MIFNDLWNFLEKELLKIDSNSELFNHYKDIDENYDKKDANKLRIKNLKTYIESFNQKPKFLFIGEAPGFRGCRFSGIPFTSEKQLVDKNFHLNGLQTSKNKPFSESTATIFWSIMEQHHNKFFIWNAIPFHPHKKNDICKNRPPRKKELQQFENFLKELISLIKPEYEKIISIGKKAEKILNELKIDKKYIRHPSHGGKSSFEEEILKLFH